MATFRKRARTLETPMISDNQLFNNNGEAQIDESPKVSGYEQFREERIKANLERMQKLGILDLSLKLKTLKSTPKNHPSSRKTPQRLSPLPASGPVRRSSRLQNGTPVSYSEIPMAKNSSLDNDDVLLREGSRPEVYTEEHEKLLGGTEMSWTLFVDGYGKDGKRIYDPVRGKTCHQCRQKTLGHRTRCCKCDMVQGQFCGDCLYMRYGEHVLEAKQNPDWICPVCRGICNCSLCRQAKGWPATGALYKKVLNMGFKSVAHYLIQTRRSKTESENKLPVSAKRSLPFSDMETMTTATELVETEADNNVSKVEKDDTGKTRLSKTESEEEDKGSYQMENEDKKPDIIAEPKTDNIEEDEANVDCSSIGARLRLRRKRT